MNTNAPIRGQESTPRSARSRRRGQTLAEFALTTPILLMLLFGIIEFGRIFQAWVTLQNAARAAARYSVTGNYDHSMFTDPNFNDLSLNAAATPPDWNPTFSSPTGYNFTTQSVDCPYVYPSSHTGPGTFFYSHWGIVCNPAIDDHQWLRRDIFRLVGINKAAQIGAAGLSLGKDPATNDTWMDIPGASVGQQSYAGLVNLAENQSGWFHVFICSGRPSIIGQKVDNTPNSAILARYNIDTNHQSSGHQVFADCSVQEMDPTNPLAVSAAAPAVLATPGPFANGQSDQYDAGGAGDFVDFIVYFNHPLITPLGLGNHNFIQMQARRRAINESYRSAKVVNLSDQASGYQSQTPSNTPTQTYTPTYTPTYTTTNTNTP